METGIVDGQLAIWASVASVAFECLFSSLTVGLFFTPKIQLENQFIPPLNVWW